MKLFHPIIIIFATLICCGCIDDDTSKCSTETPGNIILKFRYKEDSGTEKLFTEKIQQVNLYIFGQNGQFITTRSVDLDALTSFAGTTIDLNSGVYRVICWGNISDKTFITPLSSGNLLTQALLTNIAVRTGTIATNGDRLYYASDNIILSSPQTSSENITEYTLNFHSAHIKVQVYVKGFVDKDLQGNYIPPLIEMTGVSSGYNFTMKTSDAIISYLNTSSLQYISGEEFAVITFYAPRFNDDNGIEVRIKKNSTGETVTSINLKNFMKENNITVENIEEAIVPILVEYKQTSVEISMPEWGQNPIDPEL